MKAYLLTLVAAVAAGCAQFGYSADQLKALPQGVVICNYIRSIQGSAGGVSINADELKRGIVASTEITVAPEQGCQTTVKGRTQ
jgi:hypothetical protein